MHYIVFIIMYSLNCIPFIVFIKYNSGGGGLFVDCRMQIIQILASVLLPVFYSIGFGILFFLIVKSYGQIWRQTADFSSLVKPSQLLSSLIFIFIHKDFTPTQIFFTPSQIARLHRLTALIKNIIEDYKMCVQQS